MNRSVYRVEAAYHQRLCFYLVYVIRMDDFKTIVRKAILKKDVIGVGNSSLKKLGYNGGVTNKDIVWRQIGEATITEKEITDIAPPLSDVLDIPEDVEAHLSD